MNILEIKNISASYGKKEVLKDVSLFISKGEIVSILGPNGAGKSTLLKTIAGLVEPTNGKIFFNDIDITSFPIHKRSNLGIGYLFQGGSIFSNLSVEDNLRIATKKNLNNFEIVFNLFPDLKETLKLRAGLLSGGLKQMLSLGMQILNDFELLLLDEPSAGLAPVIVKNLTNIIKQINTKFNKTILLVEQNINQALRISNRAYLMKNGKIFFEEQNPIKLIDEEKFEKIFFEK